MLNIYHCCSLIKVTEWEITKIAFVKWMEIFLILRKYNTCQRREQGKPLLVVYQHITLLTVVSNVFMTYPLMFIGKVYNKHHHSYQDGFSSLSLSLSLSIRPYRSSVLAGLLDSTQYLHSDDASKSRLVWQHWYVFVLDSKIKCHSWVCPCFLRSAPLCVVCLTWIVWEIEEKWPYSYCSEGCCFQFLPIAVQALANRKLTSLSVDETLVPRYVN